MIYDSDKDAFGDDCDDMIFSHLDIFLAECGGALTDSVGRITSPNYPLLPYNSNTRCYWIIEAAPERVISMDFNDETFQIEEGLACSFDSVKILEAGGVHLGT